MTIHHKILCTLGLLCLCVYCLYSPLAAAPQKTKQGTLTELLALARTLVVADFTRLTADYIPEDRSAGDEECTTTAEEWKEYSAYPISDDADFLESKIDAILNFIGSPTGGVQSKNPDTRRIARFDARLPYVASSTYFLEWSGKIQTGGDPRIPAQWYFMCQIGGSGKFYQGNLALSPLGLLTQEQVNHVIATLKARGGYTSKPITKDEEAASLSFAAAVHGLKAAHHPRPEVSTEYLLFEGTEHKVPVGAKIIVTQEKPGRYALFLLMGYEDFLCEATLGNDTEE